MPVCTIGFDIKVSLVVQDESTSKNLVRTSKTFELNGGFTHYLFLIKVKVLVRQEAKYVNKLGTKAIHVLVLVFPDLFYEFLRIWLHCLY